MKKLPIGIQTFSEIIQNNYIYVDKTKEAYELITNYKYVFLSRPRRFGKSLFLDTLHEIFEGNEELFKGLYIYDKYNFEKYPVIKIDWSGNFKTIESTKETAIRIMKKNQKKLRVECESKTPEGCFDELIQKAYEKYQKPVVILIDEYDKPILDNMDDIERAKQNRDFLRGIYINLKANDRYIRFAFLTGISKFSKASIFSGLNNLEDISLNPTFGNICGYTQEDLDTTFKELLKGADREKTKEWYNGYYYLKDKLYNPFDILQYIRNDFIFRNYWWESGNPFSLIQILKEGDYFIPEIENLIVDDMLINTFDIENIRLESLLFQAGYLTIEKTEEDPIVGGIIYHLKVPNREVQISLNNLIYNYLTGKDTSSIEKRNLILSLSKGNVDVLKQSLVSLFSSIPYNNYVNNTISNYEGYYASVVYTYLASLGLKIVAEDVTNRGRIDLTLFINNKVYIIEFKVEKENDTSSALKQIKERRYFEKYLNSNKEIYLVGIEFNEKERNVKKVEWQKVDG